MTLIVFLATLLFAVGRATVNLDDGHNVVDFKRDPASHNRSHVQFVILAASSTGSTWVNHVLTTHPCVVSVGELLINNESLQRQIHTSRAGMRQMLLLAAQNGRRLMRARIKKLSGQGGGRDQMCTQTASGIKLKLYTRDITFGRDGNIEWLREELGDLGWPLLLLERTNLLDIEIGRISRTLTKQLHCSAAMCDPSSLNISLRLACAPTIRNMVNLEIFAWKVAMAFSPAHLTRLRLPFMRIEYELLLAHPELWLRVLKLLRVVPNDGCMLRQDLQKRVQQTQREVISNFGEMVSCLLNSRTNLDKYLRPDFRPSSGVLPVESPALCPNATQRNSFLVQPRKPPHADAKHAI